VFTHLSYKYLFSMPFSGAPNKYLHVVEDGIPEDDSAILLGH
jgi:hypothetical protein